MDVTLAKTFLAVVDTASFIGAAERLNVTQSTVSARIKVLEETVGKPLIERSRAGAGLTSAGHQFHKHALALVRIWEHARLEVGLSAAHRDHLAVGGQVSLWDGFLLQWVARLRQSMPDLAITATIGFSPGLMDRLVEGSLDLAVMYRPATRPGLVVEHLFDEELVLVTSGDPRAPQPGPDYVFVNWGPEFEADHAMAFSGVGHPGLSLDLGSLGVNYFADRRASGYFPVRVTRAQIERGTLHLVKSAPRFVYPAYVVYPLDRDEEAYEPILGGLRLIAAELQTGPA